VNSGVNTDERGLAGSQAGMRLPLSEKKLRHRVTEYPARSRRITESQNSRGWKGPLWVI